MANGHSLRQGTNGTKDNHCSNWENTAPNSKTSKHIIKMNFKSFEQNI